MNLLFLLLLLATLPLRAADPAANAHTLPGYKDTPLIPGTQWHIHDPDRPQPAVVTPGKNGAPPSDAIVLFNGGDLSAFQPNNWTVQNGCLVIGNGSLTTRESFGDVQVHVEWAGPVGDMPSVGNQGNSGVLLMGLFEIQIFDSHSIKIYSDGNAGAIYGQSPPLVNATLPRGEWQTYDIVFKAPVFEGEKLAKPARVTVLHNGLIVQHDTEILGPTTHKQILPYTPKAATPQPITLMAHKCPIQFRNFWVRKINLP